MTPAMGGGSSLKMALTVVRPVSFLNGWRPLSIS